ncbi:MAG: ATP--cob(I)alamin adenosyltransferase [Bacteroidia bacterium]|nr:MAG: ATP--cob(I)alamin adenosyltransferase [Bacteroidia bacterium]
MKIYTRTGDGGETSLFGGGRVPKNAPRIEAYGTIDELNSHLGAARAQGPSPDLDALLMTIQDRLFVLGAQLATVKGETVKITGSDIAELESAIDRLEAGLPPLKTFIVPGGGRVGSALHVARTVCRRAERLVVALHRTDRIDPSIIVFLNRLSDLLFVMARHANRTDNAPETPWSPR